jgi:citrate lyase subunit beta/citryl-CoA lyase
MQPVIPRSYLFVPGNRPGRFAKAYAAGADVVILDLEDAVPEAEKIAARTAVANWLSPQQPVFIRINGAGTEWFLDDLELCRMPGVAGLVLPKTERIEDILLTEFAGSTMAVLPLIETAQGFANVQALAQAPRVQRLLFGSVDFQLDLGISGDDEELLYFRSQLVLVSRVTGILPPVDGVSTAIDDPEQLRADTLRARRLGFGGKLCVHPKQVVHVNQGFSVEANDIAWAERVLEAACTTQGAATIVDGKMVDRPVILKAREIMNQSVLRPGTHDMTLHKNE